ncbi:MAG: response regulator [Rhodospirillaceae bacterium]|nr:response regulator [Rhodospirillaceae bacterium]
MARRILLIDDDELLRTAIGDLLESNGYIVASAGAGDAGLAMFRAARPDLVITDLTMPEPNGLDILRTLSKEAQPPRIIVISGGGERLDSLSNLRQAQSLGADRILEKPFRANALLELVDEILEGTERKPADARAG